MIRARHLLALMAIVLAACSAPPTSVPVTLTAPVPTATSEPLALAPPIAKPAAAELADAGAAG